MKQSKLDKQEGIAFRYHEMLDAVLKDLRTIDSIVPRESSRHGCLAKGERAAIIEARKSDFLSYIQTICRDHLEYGGELIGKGWTVEQWESAKKSKRKR